MKKRLSALILILSLLVFNQSIRTSDLIVAGKDDLIDAHSYEDIYIKI